MLDILLCVGFAGRSIVVFLFHIVRIVCTWVAGVFVYLFRGFLIELCFGFDLFSLEK